MIREFTLRERSPGVLIVLLTITVYGFYTSPGGKPLLIAPSFED